jgi:hypothetical protein
MRFRRLNFPCHPLFDDPSLRDSSDIQPESTTSWPSSTDLAVAVMRLATLSPSAN